MLPPLELPVADGSVPGRRRLASAPLVQAVVGVAAVLVMVVVFVRLVNVPLVVARLAHLRLAPALLCGVVFLAAYAVRALRWRRLLAPQSIGVFEAIAIYQVAIFVNWLLPVRAGELVKSVLLRRLHGIPFSRSLPTVAMDKTMDLVPAVVLVAALPLLPFRLSRPLWGILLAVLTVLALGALFLVLAAWRRQVAFRWLAGGIALLPTSVRGRSESFVVSFVDSLLALIRRPRTLAVAALYTSVAVGLDAVFCQLAFQAVGAVVAFPVVLYGYTFYNLGYILPTLPGQIGSNELLGLLVFSGVLHIGRSAVAAMFLFSHPWTALLMTGAGLLSLSAMGLNLRSTLSLTQCAVGNAPQDKGTSRLSGST